MFPISALGIASGTCLIAFSNGASSLLLTSIYPPYSRLTSNELELAPERKNHGVALLLGVRQAIGGVVPKPLVSFVPSLLLPSKGVF